MGCVEDSGWFCQSSLQGNNQVFGWNTSRGDFKMNMFEQTGTAPDFLIPLIDDMIYRGSIYLFLYML